MHWWFNHLIITYICPYRPCSKSRQIHMIYIGPQRLQVNLSVFVFRLFHEDFSPITGTHLFRRLERNLHETIIPLSHYSRNAPRIHNVGHFIQIAKVPSGVCKSRPAFALDSATFVAIAKCSQTQLRVGNLFHFPQNM